MIDADMIEGRTIYNQLLGAFTNRAFSLLTEVLVDYLPIRRLPEYRVIELPSQESDCSTEFFDLKNGEIGAHFVIHVSGWIVAGEYVEGENP